MIDNINLKEIFKKRVSKHEVEMLVEIVCASQKKFDELVDIIISSNKHISLYSSWVLGYAGVKCPSWFVSRLNDLLNSLTPITHFSVYRNVCRVLMKIIIPEKYYGVSVNFCINCLSDNEMPIAVKSFCIHILSKIIETHPDLCNEIKGLIELLMQNASPGLKNAGEKILTKINKMGY
ncbi:MAG: hypothetical protein HUU47_00010 [Bacteroidetes bacterium]|nr:hypothetical protein [Bacteroidota bacterium]